MTAPIITLLSDFGLRDSYVAEMKAVISSISPEARIVDISHSIEKFNIRMGAFVLASAARYFPKNTIHVAVVDPGVGTKRRALLVKTRHAFLIGPDNGLLMLQAQAERILHAFEITNPEFMLPKVSSTFHGRDVFAPAAAHLANGTKPSSFGPEIKDCVTPRFARVPLKNKELTDETLHIDDFGNIVTNIAGDDLEKIGVRLGNVLSVKLRDKAVNIGFAAAYGDAAPKTALALIGSHDFLEIAVNQGNAAKKFKVKAGDAVTVSLKL